MAISLTSDGLNLGINKIDYGMIIVSRNESYTFNTSSHPSGSVSVVCVYPGATLYFDRQGMSGMIFTYNPDTKVLAEIKTYVFGRAYGNSSTDYRYYIILINTGGYQ